MFQSPGTLSVGAVEKSYSWLCLPTMLGCSFSAYVLSLISPVGCVEERGPELDRRDMPVAIETGHVAMIDADKKGLESIAGRAGTRSRRHTNVQDILATRNAVIGRDKASIGKDLGIEISVSPSQPARGCRLSPRFHHVNRCCGAMHLRQSTWRKCHCGCRVKPCRGAIN